MARTTGRPVSPALIRKILFLLFISQPLLDMLSYWSVPLGIPEAVSIALRAALFVSFGAFGFWISNRKKLYLAFGFAALLLLCGHIIACAQAGYQDPLSDLINFIRVAQLPLFACCLISCLRKDRRCIRAIEKGLMLNYWIITLSVVLSLLTRSSSATYGESGYGIIGWFGTTNSQSSILSMLVPVVVILQYRKRIFPLFCLTAITGFAQLYFVGTRLAFLTIGVTFLGLVITALITKNIARKYLIALGLFCAVCFGCIRLSPMYLHQTHYTDSMASKQSDSARMIREGTTLPQDFTPVAPEDEPEQVDEETLEMVYGFYAKGLCDRFGAERVIQRYHATRDISVITNTRQMKLNYCSMLLDELPPLSRWFGIELSRMTYNGFNYDVENDFHGIRYLYGIVGLVCLLAFLGYFCWLIVQALISRFRTVFTLEAGAVGMAFLLAMVYAYHTAGILRRPNASFYLSVILAWIYYMTRLRERESEALK